MATALAMFDEGLRRMCLDNFFLNAGHFHGVVFFVLFFIKSAAVMFQRSVLLYVQLICKCDVVTWQVVHNSRAKCVTHDIDACAETIPKETKLMRLTIHIQTAFRCILLFRIALYCQFFMLIRNCCRRLLTIKVYVEPIMFTSNVEVGSQGLCETFSDGEKVIDLSLNYLVFSFLFKNFSERK